MSDEGRDGGALSRRGFLSLSVAGLAVVALPSGPAETDGMRTFTHSGREVKVAADGREKLVVGGEELNVITSNGAYRTLEFAFSPQPTLEALGKRVAENAGRIAGRL